MVMDHLPFVFERNALRPLPLTRLCRKLLAAGNLIT